MKNEEITHLTTNGFYTLQNKLERAYCRNELQRILPKYQPTAHRRFLLKDRLDLKQKELKIQRKRYFSLKATVTSNVSDIIPTNDTSTTE
jgi:hypothetical protein